MAAFKILGADGLLYGPVDRSTLMEWAKDERVTPASWIYCEQADRWSKAAEIPELAGQFGQSTAADTHFFGGIKPGSLRRVRILADLSDSQLQRFLRFMELQTVSQWAEVVRQDEPGDAMYLILEGELRVRMLIDRKETILTTLSAGEFFGEMCLFDDGPRSADVISNQNSLLVRITATAFQNLIQAAPDIAALFLFNIGRTLVARIRADNKRYRDSIHFARAAGNSLFTE